MKPITFKDLAENPSRFNEEVVEYKPISRWTSLRKNAVLSPGVQDFAVWYFMHASSTADPVWFIAGATGLHIRNLRHRHHMMYAAATWYLRFLATKNVTVDSICGETVVRTEAVIPEGFKEFLEALKKQAEQTPIPQGFYREDNDLD